MPALRKVALGGRGFPFARARLGGFLALQEQRSRLAEAARTGDTGAVAESVVEYVRLGLTHAETEPGFLRSRPWTELLPAFLAIDAANRLPEPDRFSILGREGRPDPWDYAGRQVWVWVDRLATAYGWTVGQVLDLRPEEAVALLQENAAEEQRRREFRHSLAYISYQFDRRGKGKYVPLERPGWMTRRRTGALKTRIVKRFVPVGAVVYPPGGEEIAPKP